MRYLLIPSNPPHSGAGRLNASGIRACSALEKMETRQGAVVTYGGGAGRQELIKNNERSLYGKNELKI